MMVAGLMLFAISGTTLSRMTCLAGGHSVLSFGLAGDCCPDAEAAGGSTVKATCCEFSQARSLTPAFVPHAPLDLTPVLMVLDAVPMTVAFLRTSAPCGWLQSRPPPMSSPERLASFGVFLI